MSRLNNAAASAAMGAACGFAFLGAEDLLGLLLRQPALTLADLGLLLPFYASLGGLLGLALGFAGARGIAAALWVWALFTAALLTGPLGSLLATRGIPPLVGVVPALALTVFCVVCLLFITRDGDDQRWGGLAGAWTTTVFAGVLVARTPGGGLMAWAPLVLGALAVGGFGGLALSKALAGRRPRAGAFALLIGLAAWLGRVPAASFVEPTLPDPPSAKAEGPPFLLVVVNGLRADHLSRTGADGGLIAPNLNRLALSSITFDHAQAQAPWTAPALTSVLTGKLPHRHGVGAGGPASARPSDELRTLAEYMSAAGYRTVTLASAADMGPGSGFEQGVDHIERLAGLGRTPLLLPTIDLLGLGLFPERAHEGAAPTIDRALALMSALGEGPWLLTVQLADLHAPQVDGPEAYARAVRAVDTELGRLISATSVNAWLIVVGDHGLPLGEHADRYPGQRRPPGQRWGDTLYQEELHVPLILRRPRNLKPFTVTRPVGACDLFPTLLELIGQRALSTLDCVVLPEVMGRPGPDKDAPVLSEAPRHGPPRVAVRRGPWKLIHSPDGVELYDLALDPDEADDRSAKEPALVEDLSYELPGRKRPVDRSVLPEELINRFDDLPGRDEAPQAPE